MARKPANPTRRINRGRGHSYSLDGTKTPGVTTLLNGGIPKPALINWAGTTVAEYVINRLDLELDADGSHFSADRLIEDLREMNDRKTKPLKMSGDFPTLDLAKVLSRTHDDDRDTAARRGTEVHRLAARLAAGEEVEGPEELEAHVDSYLAFLEEWDPVDALVELVVINRSAGYMGSLDLLCTLPDPWNRTLLDIKTSRSGIFGETALQVLAYGHAETYLDPEDLENELPMEPIDSYGAIWVRADGYDVYRFDVEPIDFRVFRYAAEVARWNDKDGRVRSIRSDAMEAP